MKEIKDYLHLYLGCYALLPDGTRVNIEGVYKSDGNMYAKYLIQDSNSKMNGVDGSFLVDAIKPILRPLSDMTEEEAGWIWNYAFDYEGEIVQLGNTFDYDMDKIKENSKVVSINIKRTDRPHHCVSVRHFDGSTIVFNDEDITKKPVFLWRPAHGSILFKYLLSKHFDLFNLIPEGLAIDKTTLKL